MGLHMITWKQFGVGAASILVAILSYEFVRLENSVNEQIQQTNQLERKLDILVSVISMKMPDVNLSSLISIATEKNIAPNNLMTAIPLLESDPIKAKNYMKTQMQFNESEINLIMKKKNSEVK